MMCAHCNRTLNAGAKTEGETMMFDHDHGICKGCERLNTKLQDDEREKDYLRGQVSRAELETEKAQNLHEQNIRRIIVLEKIVMHTQEKLDEKQRKIAASPIPWDDLPDLASELTKGGMKLELLLGLLQIVKALRAIAEQVYFLREGKN